MQGNRSSRWLQLSGLLLLVSYLVFASVSSAQDTLPPRATPPATPTPLPEQGAGLVGATIELRPTSPLPGASWSVVQWQDAQGGWHDVEGWRGTLEHNRQRWWVAPKDFNTGPFRWQLYGSRGGTLLASSAPFNLPATHGQLLIITLAH